MNFRTRLGISVVLAALFSLVAAKSLPRWNYFGSHRAGVCLAALTAGSILWLASLAFNARRSRPAPGPLKLFSKEVPPPPPPPFLLFDPAYWGLMLILFSGISFFSTPAILPGQPVAARIPDPAVVPPEPPRPEAPAEVLPDQREQPQAVEFPALKLQGLTYRPPNPSALINGRTYFVGDTVEGAKVVAIDAGRVVVQFKGASKTMELAK